MKLTTVVALVAMVSLVAAAERVDLTGTVVDENGKPVSDVTAYIYTAHVRTGTCVFCSSCFPDCARRAQTDQAGRFQIKSLDPELVFRVLFLADGYESAFRDKVDPVQGPVEMTLKTVRVEPGRWYRVRGGVFDPNGMPVTGATVEVTETNLGPGQEDRLDQLAVTNRRGVWIINSKFPCVVIAVKVSARGLASQRFANLNAGDQFHGVWLGYGATVKGRVVKDGSPMAGVALGMVETNRGANTLIGPYTIGTDADGRFLISNVAPAREYIIYGLMESFGREGAISPRPIVCA
ncbi:MAG: hypothetical protein HY706_21610 [Candidatus Hydrogenedentes bacterium]|nr:hypothetical protein [Candidatus Hydrogenedentota bacterium]